MGMVGARELLPGEAPALHSAVERLSARARVVQAAALPARATATRARSRPGGALRAAPRSRSRSGLLGVATPAELEGIVAHELAHLRNRDVLVQTLVGDDRRRDRRVLADRRLFPAGAALRARARSPPRSCISCSRRAASTTPTASRPSSATRPTALADALLRLEQAMELVAVPGEPGDRAAVHDEPVRRGGPRGAQFVTHPPLGERVRRLRALDPEWREKLARGLTPALGNAGAETTRPVLRRPCSERNGRRPTLPGDCSPSTIGASGLNFSVRNGKRCFPVAMTAQIVSPELPGCR